MTHDEIITGIPLTLEQLRMMDGEPAYWADDKSWGIISVDALGRWANIPFFKGRKDGVNFTYNIVARAMKIYAYPPVNFDRERFVPCDFCSKADFGDYSVKIAKSYATISCALGNYKYPEDKQFRYCPKCGRPLTPEAWETLEKRLKG